MGLKFWSNGKLAMSCKKRDPIQKGSEKIQTQSEKDRRIIGLYLNAADLNRPKTLR